MGNVQKTLVASIIFMLMAFVVFDVLTWVHVLRTIAYSPDCLTGLVHLSRQSAAVRPFFLGAFAVSVVVFELSCRQLPKAWRYIFLVAVGLAAGLVVIPWLVRMIYW